jgi:hypothetical protein
MQFHLIAVHSEREQRDGRIPEVGVMLMGTPSHNITDMGDKVVIHDLEVFCAYDPNIDGDHDDELRQFDNKRVRSIVRSTRQYMDKGSYPRLVVMHDRNGDEPKSSVGRFTDIAYEERGGIGYIVGDCEVERSVFERLLATNAFPRRSAEIWQEQNHLSEVALLGRETPRRPLPDTHFTRKGERVTFSRPLRFDMGTVGGGLSTYVPDTKETNMADSDLRKEMSALKAAMDDISAKFKKHFGEDEKDGDKEEMASDDMLSQQFAEEEGEGDGVHIDIDSHGGEDDEDDEEEMFPASRYSRTRFDHIAMKRENARMARELASMRSELSQEKFSRELDAMEAEGYRIPAERRPRLISELVVSRDPSELLDTWRDLFSRDPVGIRIDMNRASLPKSDIDPKQISDMVREFAGKPEEFTKAINSRIKR